MLGKCIKNEFVNRWKQVASILGGLFVFSLVVVLVTALNDNIDNMYLEVFTNIIVVVYTLFFFAAAIGLVLLPVSDFSKRFFKDQGYLTHTLPVRTSTMIIARMICDVGMVLSMVLAYPLCIAIAVRDFSFYDGLIDNITYFINMTGGVTDRAMVVANTIAVVTAFFLSVLFSLWQINAAYAFGHMFNKGKRVMSIVGYVALWLIFWLLMVLLNEIMETDAMRSFVRNMDVQSPAGATLLVTSAMNFGMLVGVAVLAVVTGLILKHRLNLE